MSQPQPTLPQSSLRKARLKLSAISLCLSISTLCACSTQPVAGTLFVPPQAAMQEAKPLPLLPDREITVKEFTDNDLEIVALYHSLAEIHHGLVVAVQQYLDQQAGK